MTGNGDRGALLRNSYDPLSPNDFKKLVDEARKKGESTTPLIKRLVLTTLDEVAAKLEAEREADLEDES